MLSVFLGMINNMKKINILTLICIMLSYSVIAMEGKNMNFNFTIDEFIDKGKIPVELTCDGHDRIPTLRWYNAPDDTRSFAVIMDDPDAPNGTWDHWIVFNIPKNISGLNQRQPLPQGALSGKNSWGKLNYGGPCPPDREHRYFFTLYALDNVLSLPNGASKSEILSSMDGHILEKIIIVGYYDRVRQRK